MFSWSVKLYYGQIFRGGCDPNHTVEISWDWYSITALETPPGDLSPESPPKMSRVHHLVNGAVAELVGIEGGVVSGVINLESSDVGASDRRPHHEEHYHEA